MEPTKISKSILITHDLHWVVCVNGRLASGSPVLSSIPQIITVESFRRLVDIVYRCRICTGFTKKKYVDMCRQKKGTLLSKKGAGVAFLHEGYPITDGDSCTYATVRHVSCELIVTSGDRCASCHSYRPTLKSIYLHFIKSGSGAHNSTPHSKANLRHFRTPQRLKRNKLLRNALYSAKRKIKKLTSQLESATEKEGIDIDENLNKDLHDVANGFQSEIDTLNTDDFRRIFWTQQVR